MLARFVASTTLALLVGCAGSSPGGTSPDASPIDPTPDASPPFLPGWHGQFCAAGTEVKSADGEIVGNYCLGPLDTSSTPATSEGRRWEPGPIYIVSP